MQNNYNVFIIYYRKFNLKYINMFRYNLLQKPNFIVRKKVIDSIFNIISSTINISQSWTINIVFLSDYSIKKLNKNYRNINKTTDVLSFHYFDDFALLKQKDIAWEVIMSEKKIISQGKKYLLWSEKEFYKLLIHSILHILWYDHEIENDYKEMQNLENKIWKEVFEK